MYTDNRGGAHMSEIGIKLRESLGKENLEISEKEEQVILLLLKHRYGLYAAEIARATKLHESNVRNVLNALRQNGLLESKEVESIASQSVAHGRKLCMPENYRIMTSKGAEIPVEKGGVIRILEADLVIDDEGFHVPFRRGSGRQRSVVFKIKKELFEILSQKNSGNFFLHSKVNLRMHSETFLLGCL